MDAAARASVYFPTIPREYIKREHFKDISFTKCVDKYKSFYVLINLRDFNFNLSLNLRKAYLPNTFVTSYEYNSKIFYFMYKLLL